MFNVKTFIPLLAIILLSGCTDNTGAKRALEAHGFHDIQLNGYAYFGCSDNDYFNTAFSAKNGNNQTVSGVVCCGLLKSCTVRF